MNVWTILPMGFPGGASGKEPTCQCGRHQRCGFHPLVGKISWRRAWQPTPICLPGESHGQRSLEGSSSWNPTVRHDRGNLAKRILPITWSLSTLTFPLKTLPFITLWPLTTHGQTINIPSPFCDLSFICSSLGLSTLLFLTSTHQLYQHFLNFS